MPKYDYKVTSPDLPPNAKSPVMDYQQMTWWLNEMASVGWEFVSYGQTYWHAKEIPQQWWIFRRERNAEESKP